MSDRELRGINFYFGKARIEFDRTLGIQDSIPIRLNFGMGKGPVAVISGDARIQFDGFGILFDRLVEFLGY